MRIFACLIGTGFVSAWDKEGHDAVGGTAMSMLDSSASSKLKGILGGEDASDVAGWAHKIEGKLGWTKPLHFMSQVTDFECKAPQPSSEQVCKDGYCLETSIRHFYRQLTRGASQPGVNVIKDQSDFTDADALRFLINLVGDVSQALHVGFQSNNFGKDIFVRLPAGIAVNAGSVVSLFELWDTTLSYNIINNPYNPNFWWSGWTHYKNLNPQVIEIEQNRWKEKDVDSVHDWISESAEFACQRLYSDPVNGNRFNFSRDKNNPTEISMMTYRLWEQTLRERILLGGVRLGILLNAIMTNPDAPAAGKLRRGSVVAAEKGKEAEDLANVFEDLDERGGSRAGAKKLVSGYGAGFWNIGILAVVVLVVFLGMRMTGNNNTPQALKVAKSQFVEMVGPHAKQVVNAHRD